MIITGPLPDIPIQCHPFLMTHPPSFHPLFRHCPLTIHSTWIGLKTWPIPIYRSRFEACLPQYVENSMMLLGDMMSPERLEFMKARKEYNISSLLVFLVSTMLIYLVAAGRLFESNSIILQTCQKVLTTHYSYWLHSTPS